MFIVICLEPIFHRLPLFLQPVIWPRPQAQWKLTGFKENIANLWVTKEMWAAYAIKIGAYNAVIFPVRLYRSRC